MVTIGKPTFYGDESGSHGDGPFVLSGYLADDGVWDRFEQGWHNALQADPKIEYFHMRECIKLEGQFEGFSRYTADRKMNALLDELLPFLRRGEITEYTAILDWDMYRNAVSGVAKKKYWNPYLFLIMAIQTEVTKRIVDAGEPVYFFFDDQIDKLEHDAARQFARAKEALPPELGRLLHGQTFRSDKYCYQLQVADFIAWQRRRKELNLPEDRGGRKEYKRVHSATKSGYIFPFRKAGLEQHSERIERAERAREGPMGGGNE